LNENKRDGSRFIFQWKQRIGRPDKDDIRLELNEFSRISSDAFAVVVTPANVDSNVIALSPS